jgi:hypothetical protein
MQCQAEALMGIMNGKYTKGGELTVLLGANPLFAWGGLRKLTQKRTLSIAYAVTRLLKKNKIYLIIRVIVHFVLCVWLHHELRDLGLYSVK